MAPRLEGHAMDSYIETTDRQTAGKAAITGA